MLLVGVRLGAGELVAVSGDQKHKGGWRSYPEMPTREFKLEILWWSTFVVDIFGHLYKILWPFVQLPLSLITLLPTTTFIFHVVTYCTYPLLLYCENSSFPTETSYIYYSNIS